MKEKLAKTEIEEIRQLRSLGWLVKELAIKYKVSPCTIRYAINPEARRRKYEKDKKWRDRTKKAIYNKQYYIKNRERLKQYTRSYYLNHREKIVAYKTKQYILIPENRERHLQVARKWRQNNPERCRAADRLYLRRFAVHVLLKTAEWKKSHQNIMATCPL